MYIQRSVKQSFFAFIIHSVLTAIFLVLLATRFSVVQAQSYQQKRLTAYQYKQIQAYKRRQQQAHARRRQAQKPKGLFGNLFGGQTKQYRRARPVQRKRARRRPVARHKAAKRTRTKSSDRLGAYASPKKAKKSSRLPSSLSTRQKKRSGRQPMCVRLCDGFYWPANKIGINSKKTNDKAICQNSCTALTRVYYAGTGNDIAQTMRDRRGNRYKDLKNAFLYRKKLKRSCKCRPEPWTKAAQKAYKSRAQKSDELLADLTDPKQRSKRALAFKTSMAK